jgi:hypothetical protein
MKIAQKMEWTLDDSITAQEQPVGSGSGRKVGATRDQRALGGDCRSTTLFDFFGKRNVCLNKGKGPVDGIKIALGMALLAVLMGCVGVGYVDGGYGPTVVVPGPDVYFYGGIHERGRDARDYSHRGFESRAAAHSVRRGHGERR